MPDIVISEFIDDGALADLGRDFDLLYDPDLVDRDADLKAALASARGLIVRNRTRVNADLLDAGPHLLAVGRLGVGLDNIDLDACAARGVAVHPATGANVVAVAEYVVAAVLMLLRGAFLSTPEVLAGAWPRNRLVGREAYGKTLGIVGFGAIGRAVAERARALGMRIAGHDPLVAADDPAWARLGAARLDLDALIAGSDAVSLHVPLTDETRGMLGAARIAAMKPGAVLVNTARGGIVDESALAEALGRGHLGGAMLDVFEAEPLPAGSPLAGAPNLVLTPHVAGLTEESNARVGALVARRVRDTLTGKEPP